VVSGVIDTADHQKSQFPSRISPRIRIHMQKDFNPWVRGQMELFVEKSGGRKSRDRVPFTDFHDMKLLNCK
jgi:hypothetical protein